MCLHVRACVRAGGRRPDAVIAGRRWDPPSRLRERASERAIRVRVRVRVCVRVRVVCVN